VYINTTAQVKLFSIKMQNIGSTGLPISIGHAV